MPAKTKAKAKPGAKQAPSSGPALLPTTVVGSYSVPEWLERLKTDYYQRRISSAYLQEIHEVAIKAALKDQEQAGVEIVSDGELRRDNDVDYFLARMPGVEIRQRAKDYYYDYFDAYVQHRLPAQDETESLGLVDDLRFTLTYTDRPVKFSLTGPYSLARRVHNEAYADHADLVMDFARMLNREAKALAAAGAAILQVDEPFLAGYPEHADLAIRALQTVFSGVEGPQRALHVCYGNRYARPAWEGHYDFLFPAVLEAPIDQLVLEFARKGYDDLELFKRYPHVTFALGLGVIDVKSSQVEPPDVVATRIRRGLDVLPPDRLLVNPDCGLRHLSPDVARAKLRAMRDATDLVRAELAGRA
jgi:5-methyltetrahydropteroyltriglutamate--homocysteine methyltransferase